MSGPSAMRASTEQAYLTNVPGPRSRTTSNQSRLRLFLVSWAKPRNKKVDLGNANTAIDRHCEEPLRRSNPGQRDVAPGLLRCARNDGGVDAAILASAKETCRDDQSAGSRVARQCEQAFRKRSGDAPQRLYQRGIREDRARRVILPRMGLRRTSERPGRAGRLPHLPIG